MNTGGPASEKTLLDEFAGQALTGCLEDPESDGLTLKFAQAAYNVASAMLAEKARREADHSDDTLGKIPSKPALIRAGWDLFTWADKTMGETDECRVFLHNWKEAVKSNGTDHSGDANKMVPHREVDNDYWAKFQDGIRIVFQPTNGWCAEIRDGSIGWGNTIAEAVENLRVRWEERSVVPDHSPDAGKMAALEAANRELAEASAKMLEMLKEWHLDFSHEVGDREKDVVEKAEAIIAKHKGLA